MGTNFQADQIGRFPLALFPSLHYFRTALNYGKIELELHETFPKRTNRNRFNLLQGESKIRITFPVNKPKGSHTRLHEIELDGQSKWKKEWFNTLQTLYGNAPYFEHYKYDIAEWLSADRQYLKDVSLNFIFFIIRHLELPIEVTATQKFHALPFDYSEEKNNNTDPNIDSVYDPELSILHFLFELGPLTRTLIASFR